MFSNACEYGIRACVVVAQNSLNQKNVSLKDIAKTINSPEAFTSKILQKLAKEKIVSSIKGAGGGFRIEENVLDSLNLMQIVDTIDGEQSYMSCVLGLKECSDKNPCPAHKTYKHIKADLVQMLENTTIVDMVKDTENGFAFLKLIKDDHPKL